MNIFFNIRKSKTKGFTLVELLVVISIISLVSTIILASVTKARSRARDEFRITSLRQIGNALELYYSNTGHYPIIAGGVLEVSCNAATITSPWIADNGNYNWNTAPTLLLAQQPHDPIEKLSACVTPQDNAFPLGTGAGFAYWSDTLGTQYYLIARLENDSLYDIESRGNTWTDGSLLVSPPNNWFINTYVQTSAFK